MEEMKKRVLDNLNLELGSDFKNLSKCYELQSRFQKKKDEIENSLSITQTDPPSKVNLMLRDVNGVMDKIDTVSKTYKSLTDTIETHFDNTKKIRRDINDYVDKIETLGCTFKYMQIIQNIDSLNGEIKHAFSNKEDELCVTLYANLCDISRSLMDSPAMHLRTFLKESIYHWHHLLKDKFVAEFEEILRTIKWPFVNANFSLITPSATHIQKLELYCDYLLQIQLPEETVTSKVTSALLSDFPPLSLPMTIMVKPLRKRFIYHFYGTRQTNRIDKPEWYFTQILSWIRDHCKFVSDWVQPVIDQLGMVYIDARVELMRGLVQLAVEKLCAELPTIQYDDFTFSHCVDEALGFDKELRENYDYPINQPSVLAVLTQAQVFIKWLSLEKKYALEKLDTVLASNEAFFPLAADEDEMKITVCADMFVTLLQTITERYESLSQPGHRLQFLDLQLELLDDFRIRLLQLHHMETDDPVESRLPQIANTVNYIENVLLDWGTTVHYLHLYHYKSQFNDVNSTKNSREGSGSPDPDELYGTVFDETMSLYKHMRIDLVNTITEAVLHDVTARSWKYRKDRWTIMPVHKDIRSFSLTATASPMFEILATRLHQVQKCLASQLFRTFWHSLAERLDVFFYEELILENRFNVGGTQQVQFDVKRNLFPLFAQFTDRPDTYFSKLNEACILLNLAKGSALLLKDTIVGLEGATGVEDRRGRALEEVGVTGFTPKEAVAVLNLRNDILPIDEINVNNIF